MLFFEECLAMAQQLEREMAQETRELFMETPFNELWQYHFTLGT